MIENLIDFVFNNLFIVIIVIAIVSNLISGSKKTRNQNEQKEADYSSSTGESETKEPETLESKIERNLKKFENIFEPEKVYEEKFSESKPVEKKMTSIEEQRKKQRDALANRFQTMTDTDFSKDKRSLDLAPVMGQNKKTSITKKNLKKRMTKKGLQESIIMAEVLGKPRSLKPYNSKRVD